MSLCSNQDPQKVFERKAKTWRSTRVWPGLMTLEVRRLQSELLLCRDVQETEGAEAIDEGSRRGGVRKADESIAEICGPGFPLVGVWDMAEEIGTLKAHVVQGGSDVFLGSAVGYVPQHEVCSWLCDGPRADRCRRA